MSDFIKQLKTPVQKFSIDGGWVILNAIEASIKEKIRLKGLPLKNWDIQINYGIKTGFNEAFIISGEKRSELIEKCPKADEIIRPIYKGRDIKKYCPEFENRWIIFTRRGIDIELYPSVKEHLLSYYDKLKPRMEEDTVGRKPGSYKWYEIQDNIAYFDDFKKEKIIWIELSDVPKFSFDSEGYFAEATAFIMTGKHLKYLTAFLNSKLCDWYFDKITTTSGVGTNRWKKIYIENLPIPRINNLLENSFINKIDEILDKKPRNIDISTLDMEINNMVLDLYQLEEEEKEILLTFRN